MGFGEIVVPEIVAEGGEEERRGLAGDAGEGEEDAGDDAAGGGFHHDVDGGLPAGDAEGEGGLAIPLGDEHEHLLGGAHDQRDHQAAEGQPAGVGGEALSCGQIRRRGR